MRTSLATVDINALSMASPCPVSWSSMTGNDRVRFCGECEKNVFDLSEMTKAEIATLIQQTEGRFCGQLFRRQDGTLLTADCPVGLRVKLWKGLRKRMAWAASLFALIFLPGCPMAGGNMRMPEKHPLLTPSAPGTNAIPESTPTTTTKPVTEAR